MFEDPMQNEQTIFALSSAPGRGGIAIIRISGPHAESALMALAGRLPPVRVATVMRLKNPLNNELLDRALVLRFEQRHSFTGENVVELHVHGGRAVVHAVFGCLAALPSLRLARAGEFTRRAMENDRIDLTQAESLADLIDADTEHQRRVAIRGLEGFLGQKVKVWRDQVLEVMALVSAAIDFSDEGDVGQDAAHGVDSLLKRIEQALSDALCGAEHARIVSQGLRVAIVGAPNVGKSTLLNRLVGREVAIVTEFAGTTRDIIEVKLDLDGYAVILVDTAGLRSSSDPIENIGMERARNAAAGADLLLALDDTIQPVDGDLVRDPAWGNVELIQVRTKCDHGASDDTSGCVSISAATGFGMDMLRQRLLEFAAGRQPYEQSFITHQRQKVAVELALTECQAARLSVADGLEFVDEHLRRMDAALSEVTGRVHVEEVLGAIFSRFCVGK
jgi:tRNA modification GTPase